MFNEVHSSHGHTLLLITKPSLQATALLQHLTIAGLSRKTA